MHLVTIIWTLICALIIVVYPIYVFNKSRQEMIKVKEIIPLKHQDMVELISVDLCNTATGWSFTINLPQISEEVVKCPILFYLETDETCLKLPLNNGTLGYTASVYKNVGKVYLTFKCLKDGVSNYHVPTSHLRKLKVLILKPRIKSVSPHENPNYQRTSLLLKLRNADVNINNYEDTLIYLSNLADINFKGHKTNVVKLSEQQLLPSAV